MGASMSQQLADVIAHPDGEEDARKVFEKLDKDKSGSLGLQEWCDAVDVFWDAIRGGAEEHVRHEVRAEVAAHAPFAKNMFGKVGAQAVTLLAEENSEPRRPWVERMFADADKNQDAVVSFEEFMRFVRNEAVAEQRAREQQLRDLGAENVDEHHGDIVLSVVRGSTTASVNVTGMGLDSEAIRHPKSSNDNNANV